VLARGGTREVALLGQGHEVTKLANIHKVKL
jgi:hypothetical protein